MTLKTWWILAEAEEDSELGGAVPSVFQYLGTPPDGMSMGSQPWPDTTKFLVALSFEPGVADPDVEALVATLEALPNTDLFVFGETEDMQTTTLATWSKQSAWSSIAAGLSISTQPTWTVSALCWAILADIFPATPLQSIHFGAEGVRP